MAKYSPITIARFWSKVDVQPRDDVCWPWKAGTRQGYGFMKVDGRSATASRMAWELANNEYLGDRMALHDCDNPLCCNPNHIHPGDHATNMREAAERGLFVGVSRYGEKNPGAKLTERDVRKIRKLIDRGMTNINIAERFNVTHSMISRIRVGKSWVKPEQTRNTVTHKTFHA